MVSLTAIAFQSRADAASISLLSVQNATDITLTPPGSSTPGVNAWLEEHFWFVRGGDDKAFLSLGPHVDFPMASRVAKARLVFEDIDISYEQAGVMTFDVRWSLGEASPPGDFLVIPAGGINAVLAEEGTATYSIPVSDVSDCDNSDCSISLDVWYVDSDTTSSGTGLNNFDDGSSQAGSAFEASNFNVNILPEPSGLWLMSFGGLFLRKRKRVAA
jgi:hypothetical protein